jgi:hypothetical protein
MNSHQQKLIKKVTNSFLMRLYMLGSLPMGLLAGLRIREITEKQTVVSVPFKNLNKNPFKSIYFAVQSMAAEMSTATACLVAVEGVNPSVAFIIIDLKASFGKKATDRVFFTCEDNQKAFDAVNRCIETGESAQATFKTVGRMKDGTVVSEFEFTWSFKQRKS